MGEGEFRGDEKRLASEIEEMAHVVYGMPKVAKELGAASRELALDAIAPTLQRIAESVEGAGR